MFVTVTDFSNILKEVYVKYIRSNVLKKLCTKIMCYFKIKFSWFMSIIPQ